MISKSVLIAAALVFLVTSVVWIIGVSNHTFLAREIGLYIGIFFLPALGIWVLSLLLVYAGFKIH